MGKGTSLVESKDENYDKGKKKLLLQGLNTSMLIVWLNMAAPRWNPDQNIWKKAKQATVWTDQLPRFPRKNDQQGPPQLPTMDILEQRKACTTTNLQGECCYGISMVDKSKDSNNYDSFGNSSKQSRLQDKQQNLHKFTKLHLKDCKWKMLDNNMTKNLPSCWRACMS